MSRPARPKLSNLTLNASPFQRAREVNHPPPPDAVKQTPMEYAASLGSPLRSPVRLRDTKPKTPTSPIIPKAQHDAPGSRIQAFRDDWNRLIHPAHPNHQAGLYILDGLIATPNIEKPLGIANYSYFNNSDSNDPLPSLSKLTQIDLSNLEPGAVRIVSDQRQCPSKLLDGHDMRSALADGEPVALYVPAGQCGLLRARVNVPGFRFMKCGPTLVAGQGTFALSRQWHGRQSVYTQAVGQCAILDFPVTPENQSNMPRQDAWASDFGQLFAWACQQPGACLRVLYPGDSVFLPALQGCLIITLGHHGSNVSATAHSFFGPDYHNESDDERRHKKPRTDSL